MVAATILAFSYVRFSSKGQFGNDSERRQIELAEQYAQTLGVTLAPPMKDLGISAFKGMNAVSGSALGRFYEGVKSGEIARGSHLIVEAVDRLSREPPLKILNRLSALLDAGIIIHILSTKSVVTSETINENPSLLQAIVWAAQISHSESKQKSIRISQANENRRHQARSGKKLKGPIGPSWVNSTVDQDGNVKLSLNESAQAIHKIFEFACIGMGAPTIARRLNAVGTPVVRAYASAERNAQRKLWYPAYVGRVISDRRAFGEYQPGKQAQDGTYHPEGDAIPDYFPAVVTHEMWLKAQQMKSPKLGKKVGGRKETFSNLFTNGIAICTCGARMVMRTDGGRKDKPGKIDQPVRNYLTCSNALHNGGCENRRVFGYARFEQRVLEAIPAIPWSSLIELHAQNPEIAALENDIAKDMLELQRLERSKERVMAAIEADEGTPIPMLLQRARKLVGDYDALTMQIGKSQECLKLRRAQATRDPGLTNELAVLRAALAQPDADHLLMRQKMHEILLGLIEYALFDKDNSYIHVVVRGGFCIEVPRSRRKNEEVVVGMTMYHPSDRARDAAMNLPAMTLDFDHPTQLRKLKIDEDPLLKRRH